MITWCRRKCVDWNWCTKRYHWNPNKKIPSEIFHKSCFLQGMFLPEFSLLGGLKGLNASLACICATHQEVSMSWSKPTSCPSSYSHPTSRKHFLAMLVALHFTPVSQSMGWYVKQLRGLRACFLIHIWRILTHLLIDMTEVTAIRCYCIELYDFWRWYP